MKSNYSSRGSSLNTQNRFLKTVYTREHEEGIDLPEEQDDQCTSYLEVFPKSIVNKVTSPDVGMDYSLNPYQGCEHGCAYCYARNSHEYWGYSAGADFERKILVKRNAPDLLRKKLDGKNWVVKPISLSGNTDCYQPIERKLKITRELLEVFLEYQQPVGVITKNALIQRDLDILEALNSTRLIRVYISITTLNEDLRRRLEPRTASTKKKLETIEKLSATGVPVGVMMAPIVAGLNSHEIFPLVEEVANRGALSVGYTMLRLNGRLDAIFKDWVERNYPDRRNKILGQVSHTHGGSLNESRFGVRMKGEGSFAEMVKNSMSLARKKYGVKNEFPELNTSLIKRPQRGQLDLWP
ncbi:MAG: PA0069 family radical SAM protein [Bacteroidota bacterium]